MKIVWEWIVAGLCNFAWMAPAQAFVDPPTFVPEVPMEGQPIQMLVRFGGCHSLSATFPPGTPQSVAVNGSTVEVVLNGISQEDPILCNSQGGISQWNLPPLPTGQYIVQIRIREVFPPFNVLPIIAESPLTVRAGATAPSVVPATSLTGLLLLGLLMSALGALVLKDRGAS